MQNGCLIYTKETRNYLYYFEYAFHVIGKVNYIVICIIYD